MLKSWKPKFSRYLSKPERFWSEINRIEGSAAPYVLRRTMIFGIIALIITFVHYHPGLSGVAIPLAPYEILGAALGALLVFRTNAGYERWWEARKLWGGIVNQCRSLVILSLAHGPKETGWRRQIVTLTAAFPHACRRSLRSERTLPEFEELLGDEKARMISEASHMPSAVAMAISATLRNGVEKGMDLLSLRAIEEERSRLIDHIGGCERILKTPLPIAYSIQIRQFIFVFLIAMPFGILHKVGWLTPIVTMLVAFPILALDEVGVELENPFSQRRLNHLPLDQICQDLQKGLLGLLDEEENRPLVRIEPGAEQLPATSSDS